MSLSDLNRRMEELLKEQSVDAAAVVVLGDSIKATARQLDVEIASKFGFWSSFRNMFSSYNNLFARQEALKNAFEEYASRVECTTSVLKNATLTAQRQSLQQLIDEHSGDLRALRDNQNYCRSLILSVLSALFALGSVLWSVHVYRSQIDRERVKELVLEQKTLDGVAYELQIARENCHDFLKTKKQYISTLGSPAWLLNSSQINQALAMGLFEDDQPHAILQFTADLFSGLNEHNRMMASAAVDILPINQRKSFMKINLEAFASVCSSIVRQVDFAKPILSDHAKKKGLLLRNIDFGQIAYYPKKDNAAGPQGSRK